jgi:hypothetical protein
MIAMNMHLNWRKGKKTRDDGGENCEEEKNIVWSVEAFIIALLSDDYDDGVSYR